MKIRCPYCKTILAKPVSLCPSCGKTMTIPDNIANRTAKQRRTAKEQVSREAERRRKALQSNLDASFFGSKPSRMIFAVAILAVVGGLLVAKMFSGTAAVPAFSTIREEKAQRELNVLSTALEIFYGKYGRYPTTEEGLKALVNNPGLPNWDKHIVTVIHPDPWKQPYIYQCNSDGYTLFSSGRDRVRGTDDDLYPVTELVDEDAPEHTEETGDSLEEAGAELETSDSE